MVAKRWNSFEDFLGGDSPYSWPMESAGAVGEGAPEEDFMPPPKQIASHDDAPATAASVAALHDSPSSLPKSVGPAPWLAELFAKSKQQDADAKDEINRLNQGIEAAKGVDARRGLAAGIAGSLIAGLGRNNAMASHFLSASEARPGQMDAEKAKADFERWLAGQKDARRMEFEGVKAEEQMKRADAEKEAQRVHDTEEKGADRAAAILREKIHAGATKDALAEAMRHNRAMEGISRDKADKANEPAAHPEGWVPVGAEPDKNAANKFSALVASKEKLAGQVEEMRKLLKQYSRAQIAVPGSNARKEVQQLAVQMQIEAKNVAELGALSGPDYKLMNEMAPSPADYDVLATGTAETSLKGLERWGDIAVNSGAKAYGYKRAEKPKAVSMTNGKETRLVQPGDIKAAQAEGYRVVP